MALDPNIAEMISKIQTVSNFANNVFVNDYSYSNVSMSNLMVGFADPEASYFSCAIDNWGSSKRTIGK